MRPGDFADALASCKREAASAFGDDRVLIEKYIVSARAISRCRCSATRHGNVVHLFERDCSLQRRHQKVIEEAPAPGMDEATRAAVCDAAVQAAKAVDYVGAGTIEFIADASEGLRADRIWFMEMNTRLQVEHPVTEEITGAGSGRMAAARGERRAAAAEAGRADDQRLGDGGAALCRGSGATASCRRPAGSTISCLAARRPHRDRRRGGRRDHALLRSDDRQADRRTATTATTRDRRARRRARARSRSGRSRPTPPSSPALPPMPAFAAGDVDTGFIAGAARRAGARSGAVGRGVEPRRHGDARVRFRRRRGQRSVVAPARLPAECVRSRASRA